MRLTDTEARELHQAATANADRADCPTSEVLASLTRGELGAKERSRWVDHLAACSSCALETQLVFEVEPGSEELARQIQGTAHQAAAQSVRVPARRPFSGLAPRLALAASILFTLAAGVWLLRLALTPDFTSDGEAFRGSEDQGVVPRPGSELDSPPERLAWPPLQGATRYRVTLFDARAKELWESPSLAEPVLDLPPEALERLQIGEDYLWLVEVDGPVARRELGPYGFRLVTAAQRSAP